MITQSIPSVSPYLNLFAVLHSREHTGAAAAAAARMQVLLSPDLLDHLLFPFGLLFRLLSLCHILGSYEGQISPSAVPALSHPTP